MTTLFPALHISSTTDNQTIAWMHLGRAALWVAPRHPTPRVEPGAARGAPGVPRKVVLGAEFTIIRWTTFVSF